MADASSVSSQVLTTLGVGSGLDVFKLAQDLTDVEKVPKQEAIQDSIDATEASISGYGLCLLYTSPSPRDRSLSRMPSSA